MLSEFDAVVTILFELYVWWLNEMLSYIIYDKLYVTSVAAIYIVGDIALSYDVLPLQLYLGIIKVLSNKCGWSPKWQTCCDHINNLPLIKEAELEVKCDYNNLKGPIGMRFASLEYPEWEDYEPKATERDVFLKNKALAHLFEDELDRQIRMQH